MAGHQSIYTLVIPHSFEVILGMLKRKKPSLLKRLEKQIAKIMKEPALGKPLRNVLRNYRRVQLDSHVLIYEIYGQEIRLLDFDHHDKIYKR